MRCGKVLWNVGHFSWDGFANRQRKTDTGIVQVKRTNVVGNIKSPLENLSGK